MKKAKVKKEKKPLKKWQIVLNKILLFSVATILTLGLITVVSLFILLFTYKEPELDIIFENLTMEYSTIIYANDEAGKPYEIEQVFRGDNRIWINFDKIPQIVKDATVSIEDKRFYSHNGVDWRRTLGATVNYISGKKDTYGGSTITQQLIKNITNDKKNDPTRKVKEILRALYIERRYSKDEILEYYLNTVTFGTKCDGIETAANYYFSKSISQVTLAEAASLVGITNNPSLFEPFERPENNKTRAKTILSEMFKNEKITQEIYNQTIIDIENLTYKVENKDKRKNSKQTYFVDQVINDVIGDLVKTKGYDWKTAENILYTSGLRIYTTIDPVVQQKMDEVYINPNNFPKLPGDVQPESAMTIINPKNGDVLGMVGGRNEKSMSGGLNRAAQAFRSPGSTIKPIAVYTPAIENNIILPGSPLTDAPVLTDKNGEPWPKNESRTYSNITNMDRAIWASLNAPAAQIMKKLTPEKSFDFLALKLGITSLVRTGATNDVNLSLALGGITNGISTLEMAAAYQIFPNGGIFNRPRTYSKVETGDGKLLLEKNVESTPAVSPATAYVMHQFLESNTVNGSAKTAKLATVASAGKTGTTSDDKDRWFLGYSANYVGAVWFGYDLPKTIVLGANPCNSVFKKVLDAVNDAKGLRDISFNIPGTVTNIQYCTTSGLGVTAGCIAAGTVGNLYYDNTKPLASCNVHSGYVAPASEGQSTSDKSSATE